MAPQQRSVAPPQATAGKSEREKGKEGKRRRGKTGKEQIDTQNQNTTGRRPDVTAGVRAGGSGQLL